MPAEVPLTRVPRVMVLSALISVGILLAVLVLEAPAAPLILLVALSLGGLSWAFVRNTALERELRQARVRALDATDLERRRIQRDLHDSAQQRLVSVRIQLGLLAERAATDDDRASIEQLGRGLEDALADIRSVTRDGAPRTLAGFGVEEALRSVAAQAALPVLIDAHGFDRYPPEIERAVYYCCVEALQNSVKHGGPNAVVRIGLRGNSAGVSFVVEDSGVGFEAGRSRPGTGLRNLADRVGALGGRLTIDSHVGTGARIRGEIPVRTRTAMTVSR
jgi:signal transduction histidine kinase